MAQARFGKCHEGPPSSAHWQGGNSSLLFQLEVPASSDAENSTTRYDINNPALTAHFNPLLTKQKMARASLEFGSTGVHAMGFLRENLIHNTCPRTGNIRLRRPCGCFHGEMIQLASVPISRAICVRNGMLSTQTLNETKTARTAV